MIKITVMSRLSGTLFLSLCLSIITITSLCFTHSASAVPAFARQTSMACSSCHFQSFPALNSFGRVFRAGGYTLQGSQPLIEGENELSLPSTLNASVIAKLRYQLKADVDGGRGEIQWPDEAAILVGGRATEHVGFLMEFGQGPTGVGVDTGTGDLTCTNPADVTTCTADTGTGEGSTHGTFLSTKLHFGINDSVAIIPFSTDGLGVGYGFELLNTGAQRSQRPIENRGGYSAGQLLGTASGEATGVAFVYQTPEWFVNYSHWTPAWNEIENVNIFGGLAHYIRLAYMPNIGGWDTGFGLSSMNGSIKTGPTDPATEIHVDGWTLDAQVQGEINGMTLGVYGSYGVAAKSSALEENRYNASTTDDEKAYGLTAKLGVIPTKTQVYLAYSSHDENATTTAAITIGVQQMLYQNVKLELYNVSSDSDDDADDYTMLMLFAGF
ncbi:MAG: hypothetical protein OEY43_08620 [Gammaproteobacteria bacterium]|nr:hypothetical protein [Gammaproteobacteria bacterium]